MDRGQSAKIRTCKIFMLHGILCEVSQRTSSDTGASKCISLTNGLKLVHGDLLKP